MQPISVTSSPTSQALLAQPACTKTVARSSNRGVQTLVVKPKSPSVAPATAAAPHRVEGPSMAERNSPQVQAGFP